MDMILY